jgi:hypothetical protein
MLEVLAVSSAVREEQALKRSGMVTANAKSTDKVIDCGIHSQLLPGLFKIQFPAYASHRNRIDVDYALSQPAYRIIVSPIFIVDTHVVTSVKTFACVKSGGCRIKSRNKAHIWVGNVLINVILVAVDMNLI